MTGLEPNRRQRELIENTDGIYLVDAGAGTGKTFAVTRRYATIVDQSSVEPDDVLLVTFTRSAATEMKERIVDHSSYGLRELADVPIQTFHSHCHDILQEHGYDAPTYLGIDDCITGSARLIEDELVENELFREFLGQFRDAHPEYADQFRTVRDSLELLDVVKELASKGIFPTADGWYRDCEEHLDGDFELFRELFDEVNEPRNGGSKQSKLRDSLGRFGTNKTYLPDAPSKSGLRGGRGTKQLDDPVAEQVFDEDREDLKAFVHDVYFEYLEFALSRNFLNFGFIQLFAFVLLCENHDLRDRVAFEYVMVDEFQDTSEIQFKLALLLADTDNLCVVGDWKQSIYSFQYADVDNIVEFENRLGRFAADLNDDADRVSFATDAVHRIELEENYRSTQTILDFSEEALVTPATSKDEVDESALDNVVSLSSNASFDETTIEAIQHEDEHEAVLSTVQRVVGNDDYAVEDEDGNRRPPEYGDIAVLTRTRDYGRELLDVAETYDFPMAYDGGVELFRTDPAKLLLAWLRILEADADRGWAVVLERAGYTLDEVSHLLSTGDYPTNIADFRDKLDAMESVGSVARRVFDRYGFDGDYTDVILHTIQSIHDSTTLTRGDLIRFIERAIENGVTHDVHTSAGDDSATVQTIHGAKGLEYPIVILANMNDGRFPPSSRDSSVIRYEEPVGLRQRKQYAEVHEHPHVYDNWRHDVLRHCLPREYNEERRLLYVAITRAESHVIFGCGEEPNTFIEELPVEIQTESPAVEAIERNRTVQAQLPFTIPPPDGPVGETPHSLMDDSVYEEADKEMEPVDGRGIGFGSDLHEFAEDYAYGVDVTPSNADERRVQEFVDGLDGELFVEEWARLPLEVDGERVTISGIVDLVHVTPDRVEIVDYKTDLSRRAEEEYRKQLSVYYHVLASEYKDRKVTTSIYYTAQDEHVPLPPHSVEELRDVVRQCQE
ncbi:UvrD-helicase domain-containing protein [Halobellus captivus]|uniref:UvrD-helicase domain-containing protein n=1 Tax=Halobellus captivus TaxID=2592614 RepID=UPI0011A14C16|nr:ATP-dependent DNA helicase [Halobellus captivus]